MNDDAAKPEAGAEKYGGGWPFVNMRMPEDQVQQLKAYAAARCLSVSDVIRMALLDKEIIKPREVQTCQ